MHSLHTAALAAAVVCMFVAGGCGFRAGYDDLVDGIVESSDARVGGNDGPGTPSSDGSSPLNGRAACGALQLLRDDFGDGERDFLWNDSSTGATLTETNGRMEGRFAAGTVDDAVAIESRFRYDLRNSELSVEIQRVGGRFAQLRVRDPDGRGVGLGVEDGDLKALRRDDGLDQTVDLVRYVADDHRFWRLREQDGETIWEISGDRQRWHELHRDETFFDATAVHAVVESRGRVTAASELWFDGVNTTAPATPGHCEATLLADDFDEPDVDPRWTAATASGDCTAAQVEGRAQLVFRGTAAASCLFTSSRQVSLRDSALSFELVSAPSGAAIETAFGVVQSRGTNVAANQTSLAEVRFISGVAHMKVVVRGATISDVTIPLDLDAHRYWRLRHGDDLLFWETSGDGSVWSSRASAPVMIDIDDLFVSMSGTQNPPGSPSPQVVRFDNLNTP